MKKKICILASILIILDIFTKRIIDKLFVVGNSKKIINNFFYLTKVYNDGASYNIFSGGRILLIIITIIFLGILFYYQKKFKENIRNLLAFSFLYSGIIGNLLNRIIYGYVIDFLDFKIFGYDFPVFNVADMLIICGVFLLIIAILKKEDINAFNS